jgi:hypothetical protein
VGVGLIDFLFQAQAKVAALDLAFSEGTFHCELQGIRSLRAGSAPLAPEKALGGREGLLKMLKSKEVQANWSASLEAGDKHCQTRYPIVISEFGCRPVNDPTKSMILWGRSLRAKSGPGSWVPS